MNWGTWIITAFVLFAVFIGTLVTISMRQDVPLVTKEYYYEEIHYQDQLDRKQNAARLDTLPVITIEDGAWLQVQYPAFSQITEGKIKLFRPSDAALDQTFTLTGTSDSVQKFALQTIKKGLYKAQMQWSMNGKEYYIEKVMVL